MTKKEMIAQFIDEGMCERDAQTLAGLCSNGFHSEGDLETYRNLNRKREFLAYFKTECPELFK
jgi:hypothetical protein